MKYDDYFLEIKDQITLSDLKNMRIFYLPFLGPNAIILYQYFIDQFETIQSKREVFQFENISKAINLPIKDILEAKKKLEAIGLVRIFESDFYKTQIIKLQKPLTPELINENKLICVEIIQKIGLETLENLLSKNLGYKFNKDEYVETTSKFYDIYKLKMDELSKIASRDKIISAVQKVRKSAIGTILSSVEYYEFLTKRTIAPSIRQELENFYQKGFDYEAINHFLDFSYKVNEGEINLRYIAKIASSYLAKNIIAANDVAAELNESLAQRNKPKRKYTSKPKSLVDKIDLEKIYDFNEEDQKNSSFETTTFQQTAPTINENNFVVREMSSSEIKSLDEVLEDLMK